MSPNETHTSTGLDPEHVDASAFEWPRAELDPVARMRVLAAGLPYCAVRETVLEAEYARVWSFLSDLEGNTDRYERTVTGLKVLERDEDRMRIASRSLPGVWMHMDVVLREGWCVMHSRIGQIGFAAHPETERSTRMIHFEGSPLFGRLARPFFHWNVGRDFVRLAELLEEQRHGARPG